MRETLFVALAAFSTFPTYIHTPQIMTSADINPRDLLWKHHVGSICEQLLPIA